MQATQPMTPITVLLRQGFTLEQIARLARVKLHHREFIPPPDSPEWRRWDFTRYLHDLGRLQS
ncbi:MAG: hypothetical protein HYY04_12870 [Chloroflexi bacterium]|nr:hypothetical protein [Chloroflexota bacterium]